MNTFSNECIASELNLFSDPLTQTEIVDSRLIEYTPITSIDKLNRICFSINGSGSDFVKLNSSFFIVNVQISKKDATDFTDDDSFYPVNNFFHSIFNKIEIFFNRTLILTDSSNYAYRAYFQTLLNFNSDDQENLLSASLWKKDSCTKMESISEKDGNDGGRYRFNRLKKIDEKNYSIQLAGRLFIDLFNTDQLMLNGVNIDIDLIQNENAFPFVSKVPLVFNINQISYYVRKMKLNPTVFSDIEDRLSKSPAMYPFIRSKLKTFNILANNQSIHHENVILGTLPARIFIAFIETSAFHGNSSLSVTKNPFNFKNFNIDYICVYKNGIQIPSRAFQPDFDQSEYMRSYLSVFQSTNTFYQNNSVNINYDEYADGFTIWGFDLTTDQCDDDYYRAPESGNIKLEVRFKNLLSSNATALIYADYNCTLQITNNREVITDYII